MIAVNYAYVFRGVHELTDDEIGQYLALFNATFPEPATREEFLEKFTRRMGPNAYFVFLVHANEGIVGSVGAIEVPYSYEGREYKFALTVDGMIAPEHRVDLLALKRMHDILVGELERRGFVYLFTKPNNNSYLYLKKLNGLSDIGELTAYAFPLRPFRLIGHFLSWLDHPWRLLVKGTARLGSHGRTVREVPAMEGARYACRHDVSSIHRRRDAAFLAARYENSRYRRVACGRGFVIYTLRRYSGRMVCFVLEAHQLGFRDRLAFLDHVSKNHPDAEIVFRVVGRAEQHLPLLRIPDFLLPNKFQVVGKSLGAEIFPRTAKFSPDLSDFEMV